MLNEAHMQSNGLCINPTEISIVALHLHSTDTLFPENH